MELPEHDETTTAAQENTGWTVAEEHHEEVEEREASIQHSLSALWHALRGKDAQQALVNAGALPHRPVSLTMGGDGTVDSVLNDNGNQKNDINNASSFDDFPFLQTFAKYKHVRNQYLDESGKLQHTCPKSTSGWVRTLFVWEARALDWVYLPFCVSVLHAILFACLDENVFDFDPDGNDYARSEFQAIFTFALNSTMGFLLVFRLNRAAIRYWFARELWGQLLVGVRTMAARFMVLSQDDDNDNDKTDDNKDNRNRYHRDEALRWLAAYPLSTCHFIRGEVALPHEAYAGILSHSQLRQMQRQSHWPLYAAAQLRTHVHQCFHMQKDNKNDNQNPALLFLRTQQLQSMDAMIDRMVAASSSMERVRSTPLPIAYVSHLRTFLLINLLLLPWVFGPGHGWWAVGMVAIVAFAFLGIEAASAEVEIPFRKDRCNALDMDGYCKTMLANVQQILVDHYYCTQQQQQQQPDSANAAKKDDDDSLAFE